MRRRWRANCARSWLDDDCADAVMAYYQAASRFIPAGDQPALLLDYAASREVDSNVLLRGTSLFAEDFLKRGTRLSPLDYLQLLRNLDSALASDDTGFMLGQQLLPGHYGHVSHALQQAGNLRQALDLLLAHQARLSPLLVPHLVTLGESTALLWTDAWGKPSQRSLLCEMMMAAVSAMSRWLSGSRLPWRYSFNRARPRHIEQYEVHLGCALRFNDYFDAMLIDNAWLDVPWPRGNAMALRVALGESEEEASYGLLAALYDYLLARIRLAPSLEQTCADFGVSPATLKRHLAQHGTCFQAELDQVRAHVTLHLMHSRQLVNEDIATYLGFHDANNFRRSLKRWTGLTPSMLRQHQWYGEPSGA